MSKIWPIILLCAAAMVYKPTAAQSFNEKLAKEYMDAGSFEKAQTLYQDLYDNKPNSTTYKALLDCFVVQEDFKSAEKHIKHQLKLFNDATIYQLDLADLYLLEGKKKQSEKVISAILDEVKENPNLAASTANALFNQQKFEAALEVYKIGMGHKPSANYLIQMAEIYAQLKDQKSFFETYLQLQEFNPAYIGTVKNRLARATTDDPENNSNIILRELLLDRLQKEQNDLISNLLSWLFIQEKNFDTAFIQLKAIDKRQKGNQKELFQLAQVCRKNEAFETALDCYNYIISVGDESPFYLASRKEKLKTQQQMLTKGIFDFTGLAALDKDYESSLEELGKNAETAEIIKDWAHLKGFYLDQADKGIDILYDALEIPQLSTVSTAILKIELGDLLLFQNNIWDAVLLFGQAEKAFAADILGQEAKFRKARVYYFTGDFGWAQGQLDVLKGSTSKLIANDAMKLSILITDNTALDTNTEALQIYARADLRAYQKQFDIAHKILDTLAFAFPSHALIDEVHFQKAIWYRNQGDFDNAIQQFQLVIDGYGFDLLGDDALYFQAQIFENQLNDKEKALQNYEKLMLEFPGSTFTTTARKKYRQLRGDNIN